ncbi:MAG: histidine phosphatase family protein [Candidatus Berkelbacteria bacterium]|nr:histidine phosphatase family protein [Candidatus Berkelbacteria bacterium]MCR4307982.1 histidine phosphatase family protein [Candidatus Berkelbacteria bacterium]
MAEHLQTIIFMVRHGQTDSAYSREAGIDSQRQLTDTGVQQSVALGRYLAAFAPSAIYSSPLDRCIDTAAAIKTEVGLDDKIVITKQLQEIYSSEPRQEAGERGESIFQTVLQTHRGEQVVAVTHQYIIGYIVADFLGVGFRDVPCEFADVYRLVFADKTLVEATRLQPAKAA